VIYVVRCLMTVLFLAAVFVIFVLLTHEPSINYGREIRYLHYSSLLSLVVLELKVILCHQGGISLNCLIFYSRIKG
jgi:hypothetical protein